VRKIFPADPAAPDIRPDNVEALAELYAYPAAPSGTPWVRANMIESIDGAASLNGRSGGLSGDADRLLFAVLRSLADVILVGASTARAEKYRPVREQEIWAKLRNERQQPTPPIAVVTRKLDLDLDSPLLSGAPGAARTILLTTAAAPAGRRVAAAAHADVVVAGRDMVQPSAATAELARRGYQNVLLEGGPTLLRQVADAGLLDDLCLTFSPVLEGGMAGRILASPRAPGPPGHSPSTGPSPAAPFGAAGPGSGGRSGAAAREGVAAKLSLRHVLEDDGSLLCRYLRATG
jgi:riboflavin biosynthesis pyrimidine reductase